MKLQNNPVPIRFNRKSGATADDERFRPHNTEQPQIVSEPTPD